jgi:hypothetical protein
MQQQALDHLVAGGGAGAVGQPSQQPSLLVGMQQLLEGPAGHLLCGVAEDVLDRWALVEDRVIDTEDRDEIAGVLDEGREPFLRRPAVDLL